MNGIVNKAEAGQHGFWDNYSNIFSLLDNASDEEIQTWFLFYKIFERNNIDFCNKYSKELEEFKKNSKTESWKNHLRMIQHWNSGGVSEMMIQLDFLWTKLELKKWIKVNNEGRTFSYPNKITMVTKDLNVKSFGMKLKTLH